MGGNCFLFLLAKHTVKKKKELSARRSMLEPFSLFLLWLFLLPSIPRWRLTRAAVGYKLQASVLMPKGCSSFPKSPLPLYPYCTKNLSLNVTQTNFWKLQPSPFRFQSYCFKLLWNLPTLFDIHTSSALCYVEHFMFCSKYAYKSTSCEEKEELSVSFFVDQYLFFILWPLYKKNYLPFLMF